MCGKGISEVPALTPLCNDDRDGSTGGQGGTADPSYSVPKIVIVK